ncbi:MAG: MmcQ/YjbR family DNA-binding protein [Oscillospiraceae bacterium]|jgi:predicted DNA-binding protein (MmcQ/YjbR family)|nr:MmcQ/YjbR family DNA-binding protein [Oscillospiraceae bacterium]
MTRQELIDRCLTLPFAYEDYPFAASERNSDMAVMRHKVNKKSFAFIAERKGKLFVNLKCDPFESDFLRQAFEGVLPGWHMNKTHWNTVIIGSDVPEDELFRQIQASYDLIKPKARRKVT